jgi:hypothetical protein
MTPADATNPYADYTVDQLYAFLSGYALPRDVGTQYEYSNLGGTSPAPGPSSSGTNHFTCAQARPGSQQGMARILDDSYSHPCPK